MTHSLHREGTLDSLERDYTLFISPSSGFNYEGSIPKVRRLIDALYKSGVANLIAMTLRKNSYRGSRDGV